MSGPEPVRAPEGGREWPRVSVVIVNWNRKDDIVWNLGYLAKQDYPDFETIVVDNGSTDGSRETLGERDDCLFVGLDRNYGPSKARNVGVQNATGKYVLFLDSDACASKHAFKRMVRRMEDEPDIGAAGGKIMNWYSRKIDQWIYAEPYEEYGTRCFDTFGFSAALALVRRDLFLAVGGYWERLFIYLEEMDLSIRMIQKGYRVIYEPSARAFHKVSPEGRVPGGFYFYYSIRNWIWIFYRYYPGLARNKKILTYLGVYLIKGVASRQLPSVLKGMWAGLKERGIIDRYDTERLTREQRDLLASLNRRRFVRLGR